MTEQTLCKYTDEGCIYPDISCDNCPIYIEWLVREQIENTKKEAGE